jgi:hypothetical protein
LLRAISLILGLIFLGAAALTARLPAVGRNTPQQSWRLIGLVSAAGLLLSYLVVVAIRSLWAGMLAELAIALCFVVVLAVRYRHDGAFSLRLGSSESLIFILVLGLLGAGTLLEPVADWDARSIWFFHAKMIYFAGGLVKGGGWTAPFCAFSHTDYPNLVPAVAAQAASLAGFWNEQLPKSALLLLLVPLLAVTVSYCRTGLATTALLLIVWAKLAPFLTNGYMDAPLALYGLFTVLLVGSWLVTGSKLDLAVAGLFVGVVLGLKNEGSLFAVALLVCVTPAAMAARRRGRQLLPADRFEAISLGGIILFAIVSGGSWLILRKAWGLQGDLNLGPSSLPFVVMRLTDPGALELIVQSTLVANGLLYAVLIGVCATGLSYVLRTERLVEPIFCMIAASVYLAGIELVYLASPQDNRWHLATSADRTTLLPILLFLAPAILLLRDERHWLIAAGRLGLLRRKYGPVTTAGVAGIELAEAVQSRSNGVGGSRVPIFPHKKLTRDNPE